MDIPKQEEQIIRFWKQIRAFEESVNKRPKSRSFVFYEGPPTANGRPGIHHVLARAFKDIICRYKTMQGYRVERRAGWDTHGLPVEVEVEKELGLKNKREVEEYGIGKFNEKCRESVWRYKQEWDRLTERIAFWLDLEDPYITYDPLYMETVWGIIKKIYDKKLLYEGHKVVPYCPRCGTSLSSHEVAQGYEEIREDSIFAKFPIIPPTGDLPQGDNYQFSNTYLLAWTTTPWTLPGNVALAVGKNIDYVLVKNGEEHYILAKERLEILDGEYEVIKEFKGKELEGIEYEPLFDSLKGMKEKKHYVALADFVTTEEGTGIVHTAVMYGEDDYALGEKLGLPKVHTVNENGTFNKLVSQWEGKFVKDVEPEIIKDLASRSLLYKKEPYTHSYPFCWRCKNPLLYYAMQSWFIGMSSLRKKLLDSNKDINWVPKHIQKGRFGEWLREIKDWNFSRRRFWGTPLPVWRCKKCDNIKVVGSIKEFGDKVPKNKKGEVDLHRPYVDEISFKCAKCLASSDLSKRDKEKNSMQRVEDLIDVWFDSGAMPFAQGHWPFAQNKKYSPPELFPADYISEAIDQTRGWFYSLLAISTAIGLKSPYKNVISLAHVLDKNGKKMSKSRGNVVDPWEMVDKYGSDALRWYFYTVNQPGDSKNFDEQDLQKTYRKFISTLANTLAFYQTYRTNKTYKTYRPVNYLDKWVVSRLNSVILEVKGVLDAYDVTAASRSIEHFVIDDLSNWYVRRSRKRFHNPETEKEKKEAEQTLGYVLLEASKLCAPFIPFLSEHIYQELGATEENKSVHWEKYSAANKKDISEKIEKEMEDARRIVEAAHEQRASVGIKVRQPLPELSINKKLPKELSEIIADEINVKEVKYVGRPTSHIAKLNVDITPKLREEGFINEFMRHVQSLRKGAGLVPKDKIELRYTASSNLYKSINEWREQIQKQNNASEISGTGSKKESFKAEGEFEWEGSKIWVGIKKIKK